MKYEKTKERWIRGALHRQIQKERVCLYLRMTTVGRAVSERRCRPLYVDSSGERIQSVEQQEYETRRSDGGGVRSVFWNVRSRSVVCRYLGFGCTFRCHLQVYAKFGVLCLKPHGIS